MAIFLIIDTVGGGNLQGYDLVEGGHLKLKATKIIYGDNGAAVNKALLSNSAGHARIGASDTVIILGGLVSSIVDAAAGDAVLYKGKYLRAEKVDGTGTHKLIGSDASTDCIVIGSPPNVVGAAINDVVFGNSQLLPTPGSGIVLTSPNGTQYFVKISNLGVLEVSPV